MLRSRRPQPNRSDDPSKGGNPLPVKGTVLTYGEPQVAIYENNLMDIPDYDAEVITASTRAPYSKLKVPHVPRPTTVAPDLSDELYLSTYNLTAVPTEIVPMCEGTSLRRINIRVYGQVIISSKAEYLNLSSPIPNSGLLTSPGFFLYNRVAVDTFGNVIPQQFEFTCRTSLWAIGGGNAGPMATVSIESWDN